MYNEAYIRDFLVNNLDFIEPELQFISKEFPLKNSYGAGGRIDILAKDKFGLFVIIEIKISDKSARTALHELQKYIALFQVNLGLNAEKCRCILISTEWHELLLPFSQFSETVDYQIDGYQLILDEEGIPIDKKIVLPNLQEEETHIFPLHNIYLYEIYENRDRAEHNLKKIMAELEIVNYYILNINYEGDSEQVIYTFALYLVIEKIKIYENENIKKKLDITDIDDDYEDDIFDSSLEEEVLSEITSRLVGFIDSMEAGDPETLQAMISQGWILNKIYRGHKSSSNLLVNDNDILKEIISIDGGNSSIYTSFITPRIKPLWTTTIENLKLFLDSKYLWKIGSEWFLKKVESINKESIVTFRIYDAYDMLFSLYNSLCRGVNCFPSLEIVAQIPGTSCKTIILLGFLEWNGYTYPSIDKVFQNNDPQTFFIKEQCFSKIEPSHNIIMMHKHGIEYALFEVVIEKNAQPVIKRLVLEEDDSIKTIALTDKVDLDLQDFLTDNSDYVEELCYIGNSLFDFTS